MASARLAKFSDREVLGIIANVADNDGWASTEEVASKLFGVNGDVGLKYMRPTAVRLGHMRARYGVVEKKKVKHGSLWRLNDRGKALTQAKTRAAVNRQLDQMSEAELLPLLALVTRRYQRTDVLDARLIRREFEYGISPERRR